MRQGRGCFALTLNEGFLYVFGGIHGERERLSEVPPDKSQSNDILIASCEKYDIENDMWYDIADAPITLKNSAACSLSSDCIYLFGGYTDDPKVLQPNKDYTLSNKIF